MALSRVATVILLPAAMSAICVAQQNILPPSGLRIIGIGDDCFTVEWDRLATVDAYRVAHYTAAETAVTADVDILKEDFNDSVAGSMDNLIYTGDIDGITEDDGWSCSAMSTCEGCYVFAPTLYPVTLTTPMLVTLSRNDIILTVNMAEYRNERYYTGGVLNVELIDWTGNVMADKSIVVDTNAFADYAVTFDNVPVSTFFALRFTYNNNGSGRRLYLDSVALEQTVYGGERLIECAGSVTTAECHATIAVDRQADVDDWVSVSALMATDGEYRVVSPPSPLVEVDMAGTGVDGVMTGGSGAEVTGWHRITITGREARVYSPDGICIYSGGPATIDVECGMVIVVVDGVKLKLHP